MAKLQHISGISKRIPFEGFDFYDLFRVTFENSKLGRMNYKLIDAIISELSDKLKIQQQQNILADAWKTYMKEFDTFYTDATCYESEMRYPMDQKLLWECVGKSYRMMCDACQRLGLHRPRTKYLDVEKANMVYVKQRKHRYLFHRETLLQRLQ